MLDCMFWTGAALVREMMESMIKCSAATVILLITCSAKWLLEWWLQHLDASGGWLDWHDSRNFLSLFRFLLFNTSNVRLPTIAEHVCYWECNFFLSMFNYLVLSCDGYTISTFLSLVLYPDILDFYWEKYTRVLFSNHYGRTCYTVEDDEVL